MLSPDESICHYSHGLAEGRKHGFAEGYDFLSARKWTANDDFGFCVVSRFGEEAWFCRKTSDIVVSGLTDQLHNTAAPIEFDRNFPLVKWSSQAVQFFSLASVIYY